jgi:hypothetical protein
MCTVCKKPIAGKGYVIEGRSVCAPCVAAATTKPADDSHAAFVQSLLFGVGAAIVGLAFYAGFTIATHFYFGYVALAVGWLIAKAMMVGSKGVGGQRYQIAAALLTYAAISLASVPIIIVRLMQRSTESIDWSPYIGRLIEYGLFSPFLQISHGVSGVIGLVILFVGLRIAWRVAAGKRLTLTRTTNG